ncbi:type II secretion system secretin GspD [Poseidonibacter lekithochrous]|uniref:type II secretion system secretin GspD n=1 Tax=Poseidonibacter TaxID=2321187 RepID=UPI001C0893C3|nr:MULTISPECIES: type II secretion system secretin GspD [Poseidonibacter]MBU3015866.1 type II secretion system secretin GspD [Poseidonibacter lekithochrous]MDO6829165.1 type II secretion system secretin GspD [Poseidonibacter sp. 1_MG-2023]
MRLIKVVLLVFLLNFVLQADEKININFKDLKIMDLVKITSKIIDKNILVTQEVKGNVDFISTKPLEKKELVKILIYSLEAKGFTLIQGNDIMRIVKLSESAKNNVPLINGNQEKLYYQMVTEIFPVHNANADYIASKIRHLISKTAKLVTNKESNTLVITDFKDNIETIKKVVSVMTYGAKKSIEIIELNNIKASDAKKNLDAVAKSIFNEKIETEKVSIIANADNNSLVIVGRNQNIKYLKKYVKNIDSNDSLVKRIVEVHSLKNVEASNVIKIIDGIIGKKKYLDPNSKPLSSVDEESNSIVLMGPSDELEYIKAILVELDKEKAQVYVQAKIIEVNDDLVDEVGIKYGIFGGTTGSKGIGTFSSSLNGGSGVSFSIADIGLSIPDLTSGLALGASLSLLNQDGALDIVSEPSILAINNKESSIYVGETISVKTSSSVSDGGTESENFKREDVGLTLTVKPRISNDNKVTLEIHTVLEDVKSTDTTSGNADTTKKEVKTTAIVNNGESVILGGLIEDKEESTINKIPVLGDVPLLGRLFTHDKTDIRKRSLVIIVTPYIIPKSKDLTYVRNQLAQLKILEDKYLRDSLIRLKQKQISEVSEEKIYKDKLQSLQKEYELITAKKEASVNSISEDFDNRTEHQKRVAEIFGN